MSQYPLAQYPLGWRSPLSGDTIAKKAAKLVFTVTLGTEGGLVTLVMEQQGKAGQGYIGIEEDTSVEIVLRGKQLFFSKAFDAITMKAADLDFFYGGIEYGQYDRAVDRYKSVSFVARFNKCGKMGTTHGFNINVDLLQNAGKLQRWIGLTIDPDIKNPPPQDG